MSKDTVWHCNKCQKLEKILMNGLCVICYGAKNKDDEETKK